MKKFLRLIFEVLFFLAKRGVSFIPPKVLDVVSEYAGKKIEFQWFRNRWGHELLLTPFYHIDRRIILNGTYDESLHLYLDRNLKSGMICFDVGAHIGEVALHMAEKVGAEGRVFAFEPVARIYERLEKNIERNGRYQNVSLQKIALSDRIGTVHINTVGENADNQGTSTIVSISAEQSSTSESILSFTLDEFIKNHAISRIDVLKIDAEGAELLILEGGGTTLGKYSPVLLMEVAPHELSLAGTNSLELFEKVKSYGYRVFELKKGEKSDELKRHNINKNYAASNILCMK